MATLPPILVELKANSSELKAKLGEVQAEFKKTSDSSQSMGDKIKAHFGAVSTAVGGSLLAAGTALTALGDRDKAANQQLRASIEAVGGSYDQAKDSIERVIKANEKYGDDAKTTQDALSILTTGLGSADKATASMSDVLNLAAKRHEDLTQAATDWVKINEGKGAKILATLGIAHNDNTKAIKAETAAQTAATAADDAVTKAKQKLADLLDIQHSKSKLTEADHIALRNAQDAVTTATDKASEAHKKLATATAAAQASTSSLSDAQAVSAKVHGQADAQVNTFTGHINALKTHVEDVAASFGQHYGPTLQVTGGILLGLGQITNGASKVIGLFKSGQEAATVATEGMTAATEAQTAAEVGADAAGLPLIVTIGLITAAVLAVGAVIYEVWTHWSTIWGWIKGAVSDAVGFIKSHWDEILGFLLGPIGLAVDALYRNWDKIKSGISDAARWVGDRVDDIVNFFVKLPDRIGRAVAHAFDGLAGAFKGAVGDMLKAVPGGGIVSSVLGHLPGFAAGGPIGAGQLSIVGENGPELFLPGQSGTIVPNSALGGGNVSVGQIVVNGAGDPQATAAAVRAEILRLKRSNVNGGLF